MILEACRPEMMPFVAIAAFAGVRHTEIKRMSWDQIQWDDNTIEVKSDQSKNASKMRGRARRMIELQPNLREILLPYKSDGPICDIVKTDNELAKLSRGSGVKWSNNVLRHSFGTYRLAQTRNESAVALEMGNSPAMIHAHYKRPVSQEKSQKWFRIGMRLHP
jgi:integrase